MTIPAAGPDAAPAMRKYTHLEMHNALSAQSTGRNADGGEDQALHCPYSVKLTGVLGFDWVVIVNPESWRFGLLTFEHDSCGCPDGAHGQGNQRTDEWRDRKRERTEATVPDPAAPFFGPVGSDPTLGFTATVTASGQSPEATVPDPAANRERHP